MDRVEQKMVLERFLSHHGITMIATARLPHYGRRFSAYFPTIADQVNPDRKPWIEPRIAALASLVMTIDPATAQRDPNARAPHLAKRFKKKSKTQSFLLSREWRRFRYEVLLERGPQCELCGARGRGVELHVDHILPLSKRWDLRLSKRNVQVLCKDCNKGKGNWDCTDHRIFNPKGDHDD